jgi:gamma-glutamylcyclotransferase (GGCT)/AIG2-like uncharacterized protein YtfP
MARARSMSGKHVIYVYGTLRKGGAVTHLVPGELYDLGWYPGIKMLPPDAHKWVVTERIEVDDQRLVELDIYEGCNHGDLTNQSNLYNRVPYLDGWIYVYNQPLDKRPIIESGDWKEYRDGVVYAGTTVTTEPTYDEEDGEKAV